MLILGSHVSFSKEQLLGCAKEALMYGGNTFMFYTGAPQNTRRKEIDMESLALANEFMLNHQIDKKHVVCHAPYIVNLANRLDEEKWMFSVNFLKNEIARCELMGIEKLVLHSGSYVSQTKEAAIVNISDGLNLALRDNKSVVVLLETMAGKGSELGTNLEELKAIYDGIEKSELIGFCLDTCHLHDSGIDIAEFDSYLEQFDITFGLDKIGCIHINDSKNINGARKDRHENFGLGNIGFEQLIHVIYHDSLKQVPKILETPYVTKDSNSTERLYPPYKFEIESIRKKELNPNLLDSIREYYK